MSIFSLLAAALTLVSSPVRITLVPVSSNVNGPISVTLSDGWHVFKNPAGLVDGKEYHDEFFEGPGGRTLSLRRYWSPDAPGKDSAALAKLNASFSPLFAKRDQISDGTQVSVAGFEGMAIEQDWRSNPKLNKVKYDALLKSKTGEWIYVATMVPAASLVDSEKADFLKIVRSIEPR